MRGYLRSPGHFYNLEADVISIGKGLSTDLIPPVQFRNATAHIPLSSGKAEPCHAVVEKNPEGGCFTLTDLNTAYGTYVNEHRIQNGAVKLTPGDLIRFGHGGIPHEFGMTPESGRSEDTPRSNQILSSRTARTSSSLGSKKLFVESGSLDELVRNRPGSAQSHVAPMSPSDIITRPETAPMNNRSLSPPLLKLIMDERSKSVPLSMRMGGVRSIDDNKTEPGGYQITEESVPATTHEGWSIDGQDVMESCDRETMFSKASSWDKEQVDVEPWYVAMLREKEQRLLHMGDEISRLTVTEAESKRKDEVIKELRGQVLDMEIKLKNFQNQKSDRQKELKLLEMGDEINRLAVFERECERKDKLVASLRDQIAKLEIDKQAFFMESQTTPRLSKSTLLPSNSNLLSETGEKVENQKEIAEKLDQNMHRIDVELLQTQDKLDEFRKQLHLPVTDRRDPQEIIMELVLELEDKDELINDLKEELKEAKHDNTVSHGVVKAQQRDLSRTEHKVTKLKIALEKAQKDAQESAAKAQAISNKFANLKEEKKHEEIVAMMEREMCESHEQLQAAKTKLAQQQERIEALSKELRRTNRQSKQYHESGKLSQTQVEELNNEIAELRQKELGSRVSNEQALSRLERLRSRIVQAVYMAPGAVKPETRLDDSEILNSVQKLINDRSEFHQQLSDLGKNVPPLLLTLDPLPEEGDVDTPVVTDRKAAKGAKKSGKK